jgi:uncharacterized protein with NRDE domain
MCLLIALFQVLPEAPLIVAANRDERYERPAIAMTVLRRRDPRILGGRDEQAGGTWLAVNERGVVAGLTNQPSPAGRDPRKRSRGELPLAFASYDEAVTAVPLNPADYNPCWMLVGDRHSLFSIGVSGGSQAEVEQLGPGLHILENAPLRARSPKAAFVERLVQAERASRPAGVAGTVEALEAVLRIHEPAVPQARTDEAGRTWPPELSAPCVHTPAYGTRSAMTATVPAAGRPVVRVADGRPCETSFLDMSGLWAEG